MTVIVRVKKDTIEILEAGLEWTHAPASRCKGQPFAKVRLGTPANRVAELIAAAWGKRISRYRWCPRCREVVEPERMHSGRTGICQSCASRVLGVIY